MWNMWGRHRAGAKMIGRECGRILAIVPSLVLQLARLDGYAAVLEHAAPEHRATGTSVTERVALRRAGISKVLDAVRRTYDRLDSRGRAVILYRYGWSIQAGEFRVGRGYSWETTLRLLHKDGFVLGRRGAFRLLNRIAVILARELGRGASRGRQGVPEKGEARASDPG